MTVKPLHDSDPQRIGPYTLEARLGAGGMGRVFLATSAEGERVAVKVVHETLAADETFRSRFEQECRATRRVAGTHTASVIDCDPSSDRPWIASEFVDGPTLQAAVDRNGPLDAASLRALVCDLADALAEIHAAGVVHRDLKPSNVLMATDGARVIDFGIAKAADASGLTATGSVAGSAAYMSPEQALSGSVGPPSDVFALGSVLLFAATGQVPFGAGPAPSIMFRVVHDDPDLSGIADDAVRRVVARCLAKEPVDRPVPGAIAGLLLDDPTTGGANAEAATVVRQRPVAGEEQDASGSSPGPAARERRRALVAAAAVGAVLLAVLGAWGAMAFRTNDSATIVAASSPTSGSASRSILGSIPASPSSSNTPSASSSPTASTGSSTGMGPASVPARSDLTSPVEPLASGGTDQGVRRVEQVSPPPVVASPTPAPRRIASPTPTSKPPPPPVEPVADGSSCYATAIDGGLDLPAGRAPNAGGPNFTAAACSGIHIKLYSATYVTWARACLESSQGSITRCGGWVRLSYPDTWDTLLTSVPANSRWQIQMYGDQPQTVRFRYTA